MPETTEFSRIRLPKSLTALPGGVADFDAYGVPVTSPWGNAVKDFCSRIRENSVVSGIARSLTTSATTCTHAFSRVKKSLTALGPAGFNLRPALSQNALGMMLAERVQ